jgi:hypothetical protein
MVLTPLVLSPSLAFAQTDDQSMPQQATLGANLFQYGSPFLPASYASSEAASPSPSSRSEGFGIGVKIGPLFSSVSSSTTLSSRNGYEFGIFFGGNRGGRVGVMGEFMIAKKNSGARYIEIPILLRINIGSESKNGLSVYGLVGEFSDIKLTDGTGTTLNIKQNYKGLDLGLGLGVGVEFARFLAEFRVNIGFLSVLAANGGGTQDLGKSRSYAFLVGFRLN